MAAIKQINVGGTLYDIGESNLDSYALKSDLDNITKNILDGSMSGSIRSVNSAAEDSSYTIGLGATAFGTGTKASGQYSFANGWGTTASNMGSHAEGINTIASGLYSHAEGDNTVASGDTSHSEGVRTIASGAVQHVQGKYNIEDTEDRYAHIIGNGNSDVRSNAHTLDWNGNAWYQGCIKVGGTGWDDATDEVALKSDITYTLPAAGSSLGGVKTGGDVTISNGTITVNDDSHNHVISNIDGLQSALDGKANKSHSIYYIIGDSSTAGTWTGTCEDITEYYDGLMISYKTNIAGVSGGTTLNINGLGAVAVVRNTTSAITTHYGVGSILMLTYTVDSSGTAYWKLSDYDSDTKTRSSNKTASKMYIIGATTQSTSGQTTYSNSNCYIGTDNRLYSGGAVVPNIAEIEAIVDAKLGVIENGTY